MTSTVDWRRYYEDKATALDEFDATYGSPVPLARMFYNARRDAVTAALPVTRGRALDLGCGSGAYAAPLASRCDSVVAVDLARGYVQQARARARSAAGVQASAVELPFAGAVFDLVLSTEVIEHLPMPTALIDEVVRVLRPGGVFVLTTPNPLTPHDVLYRVKRRVRGYDVNEHPGLMLPWTLTRALRSRGLTEIHRRTCNFLYPYPVGEMLGRAPNQPGLAAWSARVEARAQQTPVLGRCGWTQVRVLTKQVGS